MISPITFDTSIGKRQVGIDHSPYVIAEIGSNHNQDLSLAKELIHIAAECGADAVKFQSLNLNKQYAKPCRTPDKQALFKQIELNECWYSTLADESAKVGLVFSSSPTYLESLPLLEAVKVPFYKLASPQVRTFPTLIRRVAALGKPIIMSVGYCSLEMIDRAISICKNESNEQIVLLHTVSEYPTAFEKVNLQCMQTYAQRYDCSVGLSDHTPGIELPAASIAMGGVIVEKHLTVDRTMPGPDHHFALEPNEFKAMCKAVRNVALAMGNGERKITAHEDSFAQTIIVRWHAKETILPGESITTDKVLYLRSDEGISDENENLLGKLTASRRILSGEPITWQDVKPQSESVTLIE
jgi:sialic acid synthase SpsE